MDTIDVELLTEHGLEIGLILNKERVAATFSPMALVVSFNNFKKVDEDILTCSCGVSGCAGIFYGTTIKVRRKTVEWRDIDSGLPKRFYSFDRNQYKSVVNKITEYLQYIASQNEMNNADGYYGVYPSSSDNLAEQLKWTHSNQFIQDTIQYRNGILNRTFP